MSEVQWAEVSALFAELTEKSFSERIPLLDTIAAKNPALADELRSLLKTHDSADGFFEERVPRLFASLAPEAALNFNAGDCLLHFEIVRFLGEGSLAKVYLARDTHLHRLVALKVSLSQSREARSLANFQLDGIVHVYSEHMVEHAGEQLRLICLQFIAGPTLATLLEKIPDLQHKPNLISLLESGAPASEVSLEPSALKWRELLLNSTLVEAVVLIGIRLAEILSLTHAQGVLHLDIKPANILMDPYGRPFLSDFNVSTFVNDPGRADLRSLGGTPPYMSPEQKRLFEPGMDLSQIHLGPPADVYALGVVLREMLSVAGCKDGRLHEILSRATQDEENQRTPSAQQLATELKDWLRVHLTNKEMPTLWRPFRWIPARPVLAVISFTLVSQICSSLINISYNQLQVVSALNAAQNAVFVKAVLIYNLILYPLLCVYGAVRLKPFLRQQTDAGRARRASLRLPHTLIFMLSVGWLPGAWIFPRAIDAFAGPLDPAVYWQFMASIWLGWLLSMTTSLTLLLFVLARAIYPMYWSGQSRLAAAELRYCERMNRYMTLFSALFPMSGVLLMLLLAPRDYLSGGDPSFKILLVVTIALGLGNLMLVQRLAQLTDQSFAALKRPRALI